MPHTIRISLCIRVLIFLAVPGTLLLAIDPTPAFAQCGGMRGGSGGSGFGVGTGIGLGIGITREIIQGQRGNEVERGTKQGKATKKDNKTAKKPGNNTPTEKPKDPVKAADVSSENVWTNPSVWMNPATGEKVYQEAGKEGPKGPPGTSWILVNPPKDKTVYLNPATGKTIEVKKGDPAPKVPAGTTWVVLKWSPPGATGESKTPSGQTVAGEVAGGGGATMETTDESSPDRDDHYFTGLAGCDECQKRCAKQSTGKAWPNCQAGAIRDSKETILKKLTLVDGTPYVKIKIDREICNPVSCHSYGNAIGSPATGLKVCCTYKQWQKDSLTSWANPVIDNQTGTTVSYKLDVSTPCSCGQIYDAALDAQLSDGTYGRTKFVAAVQAVCPNLPLSGLDAFVKACKFFGQDVKVEGVNWNNLLDTVVGLGGAGKGESGPGWSAPPPAQVPVPDPVPLPGGFGWTKPEKYGPATAGEPYPKK
jgi:hypothetical protein